MSKDSRHHSDPARLEKKKFNWRLRWCPHLDKIHNLEELRAAWKKEDAELPRTQDFPFCRHGGWTASKQRPTGFFRTEQVNGRWWLVDPDGHLFFSIGVDSIHFNEPTLVKGREQLFAQLPPGSGDRADFYQANARLRYGDEAFVANWRAKTEQRLKSWGFNTMANWTDPVLFDKPAIPSRFSGAGP